MNRFFGAVLIGASALLTVHTASAAQTVWNITIDWGDWFNQGYTFAPVTGDEAPYNYQSSPFDGGKLTGNFVYDDSLLSAYISDPAKPSPITSFYFTSTATAPGVGNPQPFPMVTYDSNVYASRSYFLDGDIAFKDTTGYYILDMYLPDLTGVTTTQTDDGKWMVGEFVYSRTSNPVIGNADPDIYGFLNARLDSTTGGSNALLDAPTVGPEVTFSATISTPEPMSLALLGSGLVGLGALGRRFNRRK